MTQAIDPRIEQILSQVELYQAIALENYDVPAWQALPIASAPDIAFRPHCSQLEPVWQSSDTAWLWDGQRVHTTPDQGRMTTQTALELQAAGVCLTGSHAVDVPLVSTDEVFIQFTQAQSNAVALIPDSATSEPAAPEPAPVATAAPTEGNAGFNPLALVLMVLVLAGLGIGGQFLLRGKGIKGKQKSKPVAPQPTDKNEGLEDAVSLDYDFEL
jgi:hypothetical protein